MTVFEVPMDALRSGIDSLLFGYANLHPDDSVIIIYSPDSRVPCAYVTARMRQLAFEPKLVPMRPLVDDGFEQRLRAALPAHRELRGRLVVFTFERASMSHFDILRAVNHEFGSDWCMFLRIIGASDDFFLEALNLDPAELSRRNAFLLHCLQGVQRIRVTTVSGTDLDIELSEEFDWISNRGIAGRSGFTILPPGEIATYPARVNGVLVADGAVNCNVITRMDMRLGTCPLTVEIADSQAIGFRCDNAAIQELIGLCFERENGRRVGELGFGTNSGITQFVPDNSHLNERHLGVHLGFGQHNQAPSKVAYKEEVHLDLITDGAQIQIDDGVVIDVSDLQLCDVSHPQVRDDDITGDCCGFGYGTLRASSGRVSG